MRAAEIVSTLHPTCATTRSGQMLRLVENGHALQLYWVPIFSQLSEQGVPRWLATFEVTTDAMQLGEPGDAFRATFTDRDQIAICELLGISRTTGKLADLAWSVSPIKLTPHTFGNTKKELAIMATAPVMLAHSRAIDAELAARAGEDLTLAPTVLRRPVGKDWCASNLNRQTGPDSRQATNYGWHLSKGSSEHKAITMPAVSVLQPYAAKHPWTHADYSQTATFVRPAVKVLDLRTGQITETNLRDLNADATLAKLWNHDGTIREAVPETETLTAARWVEYGAIGLATLGALAAIIKATS